MKNKFFIFLFLFNSALFWAQSGKASNSDNFSILNIILFLGMFFFFCVSLFFYFNLRKIHKNQDLKEQKAIEINDEANSLTPALLSIKKIDSQQLSKVLEKSQILAAEIDEITGRKNCSRNVAETVYRISKFYGFEEQTSQLFYSAALVYDAGFLKIDKEILQLPDISDKQFEIIQSHTSLADPYFDFIPQEWRFLFLEAARKHHENLDGSGYPRKLLKDKIPYIARVIRIAESYEAMTSPREYRKICNREAAMEYLFSQESLFDRKILKAMEQVI